MIKEMDDIVEHMERFRSATLALFDEIDEGDLSWRPTPEQYSIGQQLLHIAQTEDLFAHGLFESDWDYARVRFPESLLSCEELRYFFVEVRERTRDHLTTVRDEKLGEIVTVPGSPTEHSLRSWLWFLVEHEMHHKAQVAVYLRLMGRTPPFYAAQLAKGERPDIQARDDLGGV